MVYIQQTKFPTPEERQELLESAAYLKAEQVKLLDNDDEEGFLAEVGNVGYAWLLANENGIADAEIDAEVEKLLAAQQ